MKKKIISVLFSAAVFFIFSAHSVFAVQQEITFTVRPDFTAEGTWKLPVSAKNGSIYGFSNLEDFGSTGIMSYILRSIANSEGVLPLDRSGDGITVNNIYQSGDRPGINDLFVTYDIKTVLTKPVAIYEIWVAGGGYFNSPILNVAYPKDWKLAAVYPQAKSSSPGSLIVEYPTDTSYINPVLIAFLPSDPGSGNTVKQIGRYTIAGDKNSVKKLEQAVGKMTYLDEVLRDSLGLAAPESVLIYASDLQGVDVGFEAEALAAKPSIVLYNKDILAHQSSEKIQTVLVHEIAHLAEAKLNLFKGATYIAPWFKEGLAVFVENQARNYIYSDPNRLAVADAFGDSHIFTPGALKERYMYHYDYLYDGENTTTISESYTLSGVTWKHFFDIAGVEGIGKLFSALKDTPSNQVLAKADSERIMSGMTSVSGLTREDLEFPFEFDDALETKATPFTRLEYSDSEMQAIANAINKEVPNYLSGGVSAVAPPEREDESVKPDGRPIQESVISTVTSLFGFGKKDDTKKEKEETRNDTVSATGTAAVTEVAGEEQKEKSFIDHVIDFFRSLFGG